MKNFRFLVIAFIIALIVSSCSTTDGPEPEAESQPGENETARLVTLDDQLVQVAKNHSGFGGMFFDDNGDLNVYVQDELEGLNTQALETQKQAVTNALTDVFGEHLLSQGAAARLAPGERLLSTAATDVKLLKGQFDLLELFEWRKAVNQTFELEGVVFTDLDEGKNRVRVAVEDFAVRGRIEKELTAQGIPLAAVIFEEVGPIRALATLQDKVSPSVGGVQITNEAYHDCTLGFNAYLHGIRGFVTNSHCTRTLGAVESTKFYQPTVSNANYLGLEIADPSPFTGGQCPPGRKCRWSDSAFVAYAPFAQSSLGRIARPDTMNTGSLDISSTSPYFTISSEQFPNQFQTLQKIGRTTGWTSGGVASTCVDVLNTHSGVSMLCQEVATRGRGTHDIADEGDSGSPVFGPTLVWSPSGLRVTTGLYGILWGTSSHNDLWIFSKIYNIEYELGALKTHTLRLFPATF